MKGVQINCALRHQILQYILHAYAVQACVKTG